MRISLTKNSFPVFEKAILWVTMVLFALAGNYGIAFAQSAAQRQVYGSQIFFYNNALDTGCAAGGIDTTPTTSTTSSTSGSNTDYAGNPILTQGQLQAISQNQSVYQQAAQQVGIPWQMLAVIHLRESGLKVANPGNGQGIYQFADEHGGPYPTGPVDQAEFLRQSVLAAQYIKQVAGGNYPANRNLSTTPTAEVVKDTFFSYNGRASVYMQQAASLGFDAATQGYEGSPYVMNKADAKRDPAVDPTGWGQIKTDHGGLSYPAGSDYGAFVTYAAISGGISSTGSCLSNGSTATVNCQDPSNSTQGLSPVRQNVVCIAQQELALWDSGQLKPGVSGYGKYSQGRDELWCGDFVSWVYDQAKDPLKPDPNWAVPAVSSFPGIPSTNSKFQYHLAGSYTPKPGDIIVHKNGESHVNLVVGVSGNQMTELGGDQAADSRGWPDGSRVSKYSFTGFTGDGITGYLSPD